MKAEVKRFAWLPFAALLLIATLAGCGRIDAGAVNAQDVTRAESGGEALSGKLVITGSSTVAPLVAELGKRFERLHPLVRIDVQTGGSSRGVADARSGVADMGMASRALKAGERDLLAHQIASDEIRLIVHRDNPLGELTSEQIVSIFQGDVENWAQVGGEEGEIVVVHKADGRATQEVFLEFFKLRNENVSADLIVGDNQHGIKTVAGNPLAIGYVSAGSANVEMRRGGELKMLNVTADSPGGAQPRITRPLNLITRSEPVGLAKAFVEFARSEDGRAIVEGLSFVPVGR